MDRTEMSYSDNLLNIVLYEPEIPHNTGSVGRTCVAVGAKLWLVRPFGFQIDDRKLRRAGLDYWQHLNWEAVDDWSALVERIGENRMWFFSKTAQRFYTDVDFVSEDVCVFGSESRGLPRSLLEAHQGRCLRIPIRPQVRSLNLSVSVALAAFEAQRQWA